MDHGHVLVGDKYSPSIEIEGKVMEYTSRKEQGCQANEGYFLVDDFRFEGCSLKNEPTHMSKFA